ncbi:MAG TPA: 4-hydroxybenzoate octaprenyltransferase [Stellaceae bacterium]|nr:4-hydroxybenzoate octaprenyltransferase [Stellaceae bacterium]
MTEPARPHPLGTMPPDAPLSAPDIRIGWVDRWLPTAWRPYAQLARLDRPIGWWLLLLPGWWAIALAASDALTELRLIGLFLVGAIVMRGAGCTLNDVVDRDFDAAVARTRTRPLPSGAVSVRQAWIFLVLQALIGAGVLVSLNWPHMNRAVIGLGLAVLLLIGTYPFMKRITWWPQLFLGLNFNWGALLGWAAAAGYVGAPALALYVGGIAWTLGYDTIYAHLDKADDVKIGVKSTALRLGAASPAWVAGFFAASLLGFAAAGMLGGLGPLYYLGLVAAAGHLAWQVRTWQPDDPENCLVRFQANRITGWLIFAGCLAARLG